MTPHQLLSMWTPDMTPGMQRTITKHHLQQAPGTRTPGTTPNRSQYKKTIHNTRVPSSTLTQRMTSTRFPAQDTLQIPITRQLLPNGCKEMVLNKLPRTTQPPNMLYIRFPVTGHQWHQQIQIEHQEWHLFCSHQPDTTRHPADS